MFNIRNSHQDEHGKKYFGSTIIWTLDFLTKTFLLGHCLPYRDLHLWLINLPLLVGSALKDLRAVTKITHDRSQHHSEPLLYLQLSRCVCNCFSYNATRATILVDVCHNKQSSSVAPKHIKLSRFNDSIFLRLASIPRPPEPHHQHQHQVQHQQRQWQRLNQQQPQQQQQQQHKCQNHVKKIL